MSSRRHAPWGPDIAGVLICAVVFGMLRGSPLGFTADPQGFLAFAAISGALVGIFRGRPDRQERLARFFLEALNIAGVLTGAVIAMLLRQPPGAILVSGLVGGVIAKYYEQHPDRRERLLGHDPRPCRQGRTTDQEPSQPGTGTTGTDAEQRRQTDQDPSQPTPTPLSAPSDV